MKQFGLLAVAAISACLSFSSCSNDAYNPDNNTTTPVQPGNNPIGEGFTAPSDFDWSMINTVNLNVEVKDEFSGQYDYLVEVFTSNPLSDTSATPIAAGVAKQGVNYTAELNISKTIERIFIRQTDPKQRKEIYEYAVPTGGGTLNCQLYYSGSNSTSSLKTRSVFDGGTSGWNNITDPGYTEQTYNVSSAQPVTSSIIKEDGVYIIKANETFQGRINDWTKTITLYVQGTWDVTTHGSITPQRVNIIVLNGGKIVSRNGEFEVADQSSLTIQSGGEVNCNYFSTATHVLVKNFGKFHAKGIKGNGFNTGTVLYNAKNATFKVDDSFYITSSTIYNHGTIEVTNATNGLLQTNNDLSCVIANYAEASVKAHAFKGGATVVNNGFIEVDICENTSSDALYNNCTFIVKKSFKFRHVVLDKGSITGGRESLTSQVWLPVPYVESQTDSKFTLIDGSMIKATNFVVLQGSVVFNATNTSGNTSKSMIKAENMYFNWNTQVKGNLVLEEGNEYYGFIGSLFNNAFCVTKEPSVATTGFDESKYTIETCGGLFDDGNEGGNPSNPTVPVVEDATKYTYAFEDNWPAYGDFDLNDLVTELSNKSVTTNASGYVTKASFVMTLKAVGANKTLGLGIRFLKLSSSVTPSKFTMQGNNASFESGQTLPTLILFNNAHSQFSGAEGNEFINTSLTSGLRTANDPQYTISFEFNASDKVPASAFNINNFDVFIISQAATAKTKRTEIHVAGYAPTDLANTALFKQANDNSSAGHYYLSTENLAWGFVVPDNFAWPLERKKVTDVYSQFKTWIVSGGQEDTDWYTTHNSDVYTK